MRLVLSTLASIVLFSTLVSAWDVDPRCPPPPPERRLEPDKFLEEDGLVYEDLVAQSKKEPKNRRQTSEMTPKGLRGSPENQINLHRELEVLSVQMKMYWEEGYCWQEEWEEREWCLECQGNDCNQNDYLWVKKCDDDVHQRFIYEEVAGTGGGKIKPLTRPDLCWERTRVNAHQLKPCSTNTTQIIIGFEPSGRFELHPYGYNDTDPVPKCLNQQHHPKDEEIVRAEFCSLSRHYKTSRWIVRSSAVVPYQSTFPEVEDKGAEGCTSGNKCGLCEGDCDEDDDCEGSLKCFQREEGFLPVPGCKGAETRSASKYNSFLSAWPRIWRLLIYFFLFVFL